MKKKLAQVSPEDPPEGAFENPEEYFITRRNYILDSKIIGIPKKKSVFEGYLGDIQNRKNDPYMKALRHFGQPNSEESLGKIRNLRSEIFYFMPIKKRNMSLDKFCGLLKRIDFEKPVEDYWEFVKDLSTGRVYYGNGSMTLKIQGENGNKKVTIRDHPRG